MSRLDLLLAAVTLAAAPVAVWRWHHALPDTPLAREQVAGAAELPAPLDEDSLAIAFEAMVNQNPFRLSRAPSDIPYSPDALLAPQSAAPTFAPMLVLRGIVGGPPWLAVIDGIPGSPQGMVVRGGSVFDKLTIQTVTRDSVFVQTPDSAWYLTLARGTP